MKISVLVLTTLITFGSVTPAQAGSPIVRGFLNDIFNTAISSQRRHHPHQRHRQARHDERRQSYPYSQYHQNQRVYY